MKLSFLVVGGAGYIGSHMCQMLLGQGHEVSVFDNFSRGHRDAISSTNIIEGDIRSPADLKACFTDRHFDVVLHFAALAYVGESVSEPALYYENNVVGTLNLLNAMREAGIKHFVFSSTCATYGEPLERPITESHSQLPVNPYGKTKLMVEQVLSDYGLAYGLSSISLRYFNAAGCDPGGLLGERHEPETHLIPLVLEEALRIKGGGDSSQTRLQVYGNDFPTSDGTCVRDYIHVQDLCAAHLCAVKRLVQGLVVGAEAFNLGNGKGYSVLEVIEACRRVSAMDIQYRIMPRRAGDPAWLVGSADKAHSLLGWKPEIPAIDVIVGTAWNWMCAQANGNHE
jgi:UDP-glucose-4-epimerase GalE